MAYLVRSRRLGSKSSASIEFETSTMSIISMPRAFSSRSFEPSCGRAAARSSASATTRQQEDELEAYAPEGYFGHELFEECRGWPEAGEAPSGGASRSRRARRAPERPQEPEVLRIGESEHVSGCLRYAFEHEVREEHLPREEPRGPPRPVQEELLVVGDALGNLDLALFRVG